MSIRDTDQANRHTHTRTHDEVDTRGSLVGCPRCAAVVVACSFFLFLLFVIVPRSSPFRLFLVSLGDPSLGDPLLAFHVRTQDSSEALRFLFRETVLLRLSCFLLFSSFLWLGLVSFAAAPHITRKGRTHLLVGIPPGGRTRPSAE